MDQPALEPSPALPAGASPDVEETPVRLSYSSISSYELCPLQYRFRYVDGLPSRRTPALAFGESLHVALRKFHAQPVPVPPSVEQLLAYLDESWDGSPYTSEQEERSYRDHAREVLTAYHRANARDFRLPVALEQRFRIDIDGVTVSGVIDRMDRHADGSYEIIDYKTSRRLPPRRFVEDDLQLSIYYLAAWEVWGIRPDRLTLYFLLPGQPVTVTRTPADAEATRARVAEVAARIKAGEFSPRENRLCDWCDYQARCPIWAHKFQREQTPVDIGRAVDEWITLKRGLRQDVARLEEISRVIHEYCEANALRRLFGDDAVISRVARSEWTYDGELVRKALEPLGLWERVVQVNDAAVGALLDDGLPEEAADALRAARTDQTTHALYLKEGRRRSFA